MYNRSSYGFSSASENTVIVRCVLLMKKEYPQYTH